MTFEPLSQDQIESRVGMHHDVTGMEYPSAGLQPYYEWLVRTLHLLAESSCGALRVGQEAGESTVVRVAPGRATISDVALAYEGGTHDLSTYNNSTAYIWLKDDGGSAAIGVDSDVNGWPAGAHLKLAEVTLSAGAVTTILDRRFETVFRV